MTSVPIPTFVPQDAWYSLTLGNLNPNIADTVPVAADLLPYLDSTNTLQDGIVGALDGAVIYLAGTAAQLDGGQAWLMWEEDSLAVSDGLTVFCPFVDTSKHGRWINTGTGTGGQKPPFAIQTTLEGFDGHILSSTSPTIIMLVEAGIAGPTSLSMPVTTFLGQQVTVKDTVGDAGTNNITLTGPIDGGSSYVIQADYGSVRFVWSGTEWSAI